MNSSPNNVYYLIFAPINTIQNRYQLISSPFSYQFNSQKCNACSCNKILLLMLMIFAKNQNLNALLEYRLGCFVSIKT